MIFIWKADFPDREGETEWDPPPSGSLPKWPFWSQEPGASCGSPTWVEGVGCFPRHINREPVWFRSGVAGTWTGTQTGCQSYRQRVKLTPLWHGTTPSDENRTCTHSDSWVWTDPTVAIAAPEGKWARWKSLILSLLFSVQINKSAFLKKNSCCEIYSVHELPLVYYVTVDCRHSVVQLIVGSCSSCTWHFVSVD